MLFTLSWVISIGIQYYVLRNSACNYFTLHGILMSFGIKNIFHKITTYFMTWFRHYKRMHYFKITALNSKFFHKFLFLAGYVVRHQEDRCYCGIFYQSCYLRSWFVYEETVKLIWFNFSYMYIYLNPSVKAPLPSKLTVTVKWFF